MNKDMINIDDFVREKLGRPDEQDEMVPWLRMKDLLDKEMPQRAVPVGFRFRRPLVYLSCLAVLLAAGVGAYKMSSFRKMEGGKDVAARNEVRSTINSTPNTYNHTSGTAATAVDFTSSSNNNTTSPESGNAIGRDNHTTNNTNNINNKVAVNSVPSAASINNNLNNPSKGNNVNPSVPASGSGASGAPSGGVFTANDVTASTVVKKPAANGDVNNPATHKTANVTKNNDRKTDNQKIQELRESSTGNGVASLDEKTSGNRPQEKIVNVNQHKSVAVNVTTPSAAPSEVTDNVQQPSTQTDRNSDRGNGTASTQTHQQDAPNRWASSGQSTGNNNSAAGLADTKERNRVAKKNGRSAKNSKSEESVASKDSMNKVLIVKKLDKKSGLHNNASYKADTVSIEKIPVAANETTPSLNNNTLTTPAPSKTVAMKTATSSRKGKGKKAEAEQNPAARLMPASAGTGVAPAAAATADAKTVAKKKHRGGGLGLGNMDRINQLLDNMKYDIGHAELFIGATAGVNKTFGPNGLGGMQLGVTGELVFNEHLSLMAELKYFNRSGSNKRVDDDYTSMTANYENTVGGYSYYTLVTDSVQHYFNFSTVHSFEMPLTLRYAINKFYLMTGVNLAYYLDINAEELVFENHAAKTESVATQFGTPYLSEKKRQFDIQDFSARFGIGYIFGCGYQLSPAWQLDLRMTSLFWDNSKTEGARKLSRDFYQVPSIQLSIGYQFSKDKSKPTFSPEP